MTTLSDWLGDLDRAGAEAAAAEDAYRRDFARRVAELAEGRAIAFRRANLVRAVADAVSHAEDQESAVAHGLAALRTRLGWSSDSEARSEILARFAPVCEAMFSSDAASAPHAEVLAEGEPRSTQVGASFEAPLRGAPQDEEVGSSRPDFQDEEGSDGPSPAEALAAFESWYLAAKGTSFWILFENVLQETPLVDW